MGWFSKIENPLVRELSIACWRLFSDLDLTEARKTQFNSLHDCFTRELRPGLRPFDPDPQIVASPCDAIVGAFGAIADTELFQIKGAGYSLLDLLGDPELVDGASQWPLHHAAADVRACITAFMRRTMAGSSRSTSSAAIPGTSIRSR